MGKGFRLAWVGGILVGLVACGPPGTSSSPRVPDSGSGLHGPTALPRGDRGDRHPVREPAVPFDGGDVEIPAWQPGFHQALRWSTDVPETTTFRVRIPVGRPGERIRLAFRAGDGDATIERVTVARAGTGGALASAPLEVTFGGDPGVRLSDRERVVSDSVELPVSFREELYVSLVARGSLAAGAIDLFPDSYRAPGDHAGDDLLSAEPEQHAIGLASVLVSGAPKRTFLALGDSITEAFVSGSDDYRRSWPAVAEARTGLTIVNGGVSGQGVLEAIEHVPDEVAVLPGITDCLVMIGTNNLWNRDEHQIADILTRLIDDLEPICTVWLGTLPPKDRPEIGEEIRRRRRAVNGWIRSEAKVAGVIDFEAVLRSPDDPDVWLPGLAEDGVHPSVQGQFVMGEEAARFLQEEVLDGKR